MPAAHDVDMGRSKLIVAIALIVIAVLAAYREFRARRYTEALLNEWLSRNCAIGERGALERELQRYGSRLEPRLEQAFVNGPPADLRTQWLRIEQREQKEVVAAIDAGRTHGLSADAIAKLRIRSLVAPSDAVLNDRVEAYRSAALAGLGVIGDARAREFLRKVQSDPDQRGYSDAAEHSLGRAAPRK